MFQRIQYILLFVLAMAPFAHAQGPQSTAVFDQLIAANISTPDAVANSITANPSDAAAITRHALQAQPENLPAIIKAAVAAAPEQARDIVGAGFDENPDQAVLIVSIAVETAPERTPEILELAMDRFPWKFATFANRDDIKWAQIRKAAEAKFQQDLNRSQSESARLNAQAEGRSNANNYVEDITERNFRRSASPN